MPNRFNIIAVKFVTPYLWQLIASCKIYLLLLRIIVPKIQSVQDIEAATRLVYSMSGLPIRPGQIRWEIKTMLRLLNQARPKYILEIGTGNGGTLFLFSRVPSASTIISIGLHKAQFGGDYSPWKKQLYESFALSNQRIIPLRVNSHDPATVQLVKTLLGNTLVDFLFLDGDHTYDGVKADFELYSPLVKEGGIIAFHDIMTHPTKTNCEVDKLWKELRENYRHAEIISRPGQDWAGIGIIYL